jgi:hypothetical protein
MKTFALRALIALAAISGCCAQEVGRASYYRYSRSAVSLRRIERLQLALE